MFKEGDIVKIKSISNNQQHLSIGDGETYFLNKQAKVACTEKELDGQITRVWVEPDNLGYILWFDPKDLIITEPL